MQVKDIFDDNSKASKNEQEQPTEEDLRAGEIDDGNQADVEELEEEYEDEEEEEYESEEDEMTDPLGDKATKDPAKPKKEFDPRTDKLLDIDTSEDYLMEALKNFKPPVEPSMDKSQISALENQNLFGAGKNIDQPSGTESKDISVIAGLKMNKMVEADDSKDIKELRELNNSNFRISNIKGIERAQA